MAKFTIRRAATRLTSRCVASFRTQFYLMRRDTRHEAFATYCELGLCKKGPCARISSRPKFLNDLFFLSILRFPYFRKDLSFA